jgi:hypothetical protein
MGLFYALVAVRIGLIMLFGFLWRGPAMIHEPELRYLGSSMLTLTLMTGTMAYACFKATVAEKDTSKWFKLNVAVLILSFLSVVSMALYCWAMRAVSEHAYMPSAIVVSVWIVQAVFGCRAYLRHIGNDHIASS